MTLFEYLFVLVSIVLSFGIVRLLDGFPFALKPGRRYGIHAAWVGFALWLHMHVWWVLWSYSGDVGWNYPRFLVVLADPLLLYSVAITLVPRDPTSVPSWREHFYGVRARFFALLACWMIVVSLANWLVLGHPFLSGVRLAHLAFVAICCLGMLSARPRVQGAVVVLSAALLASSVAISFLEPGSLRP